VLNLDIREKSSSSIIKVNFL